MPKFRKKPVVIEAVRLLNENTSIVDAVEFTFSVGMECSLIWMNETIDKVRAEGGFIIPTIEGDMKASFGDWIIKGVNGEFYPCKPDIFEKTYEPVV